MGAIRAIVYGVGRINLLATRLMLEKGVAVVGAVNRAGPKVGRDLGELAGLGEPLGVRVSDDAEAVLATPADIVMMGVYDDMERMFPIFERCLAHRRNVISVGAHHSYPWRMAPGLTARLDAAAKASGVTVSASGSQDFFMVNLATLMSGVSHRLEGISHRSLTDVNGFGPEVADIAYVDLSPAEFEAKARAQRPSVYTTFWENIASDLELTVLDISQTVEPVIAGEPRYCRSRDRSVEPGRVSGIVQRLEVATAEPVAMRGEYELRLCAPGEEEYKEWKLSGEPRLEIKVTDLDAGFCTVSQYVNRIPHVIAARPGYVTLEKLPKLTYRAQLTL